MFRSKVLQMNGKATNSGYLQKPLFVEVAICRTPTVCILIKSYNYQSPLNEKSHITHLNNYNACQIITIFLAFSWKKYVQLLKILSIWKDFYFKLVYTFNKVLWHYLCIFLYRIWFISSWKLLYDRDLTDIISMSGIKIIKVSSTPK